MMLHALEIPDDPAELPGWLERHLMGLDLAALVAELEAVHPAALEAAASVPVVLGDRLEAVLEGGLSDLPPGVIQQLLRGPRLLLALQDLVLEAGGDYWDRVGRPSPDLDTTVGRGRTRLEAFLATEGPQPPMRRPTVPSAPTIAWSRRPWVVSLATAAAVLLAVIASQQLHPPVAVPRAAASPGWGWNKPGALPGDLPATAYLDRLADAAEEWFRKRPEEPIAVARRIAEFRQGCSVLIFAGHLPLSVEDRHWLVDRCRAWAAKLDVHLAGVEAGRDPLQVRSEADETIGQLIAALRQRARAISSG
jgi:hypothetical protein